VTFGTRPGRRAFLRTLLLSVLLAALGHSIAPAFTPGVSAQTSHANTAPPGDTSGGPSAIQVTINFRPLKRGEGCEPFVVGARYKRTDFAIYFKFICPLGPSSIQTKDVVTISINRDHVFTIKVTTPKGKALRSWSPPITALPPVGVGPWQLYALTSHGYVLLKKHLISSPGVYKWVKVAKKK
jgi:hypothetical protein